MESSSNSRVPGILGRAVRALYRMIPVDTKARIAIKEALFRAFPRAFRRTNAYRRWLTFGGHSHLAHRPMAEQFPADDSAGAGPSRQNRYVAEIMRRCSAQHSPEYVPLTTAGPPAELAAKAIAWYLPQFHPIAENNQWWGRGFTEWTNVSKALPQFLGHYQPHLPGELGFYDLRLKEVMARQIELAKLYGVHGFCFHYYWFSGRRLLERPLQQFVDNLDLDFPFCLSWANENWTRRWDGMEDDVLLGQTYNDDNDEAFIRDLARYLRDHRYIRIDGKPLVVVYRPSLLPDCKRTVQHWRSYCRENGLGEIFLGMVQFDVDDPRVFGFDAAIEFPPHKLARGLPCLNEKLEIINDHYEGYVVDYAAVVQRARHWPVAGYPMMRGVFPSWDNEARKPGRGYTFANASPEAYQEWLQNSVEYAEKHPVAGEKLVFINAWNEWAEGAHLEPDRRFGYGYLQATRNALEVRPRGFPELTRGGNSLVAVIAHDAHPHGAQFLSLNLARELRQMAIEVEVTLLGDGPLEEDFHACCPTMALDASSMDAGELACAARDMKARGVRVAIANTAASGRFVRHLHDQGIEVVSLIHELPGVIEQFGLQRCIDDIAGCSQKVVFAAPAVEEGFKRYATLGPQQAVIRPQGLYKRNRVRSDNARAAARTELRGLLGIPPSAEVVLCVGYADLRKGVDLFVEMGKRLLARRPSAHLVWVGHPDTSIEADVAKMIAASGRAPNFRMVGRRADTDIFYAGADLYALTSREDPYPSVALEAMDAGIPVVGFEGCGGLDPVISEHGLLVAMGDVEAFALACDRLLDDHAASAERARRLVEFIEENYSFRSYVLDLLAMTSMPVPRVSVVVPNFNYAHYLPQRLKTICDQSMPLYEVIILDDASTDDSVAVAQGLQAELTVPVRLVASARNSGSVFRQWLRGVELAKGDFVWIAEADDLSDPEFLARVVPCLCEPGVVMAYAQSKQIGEDGAILSTDYLDYTADVGEAERWRAPFVSSLEEELANGLAVKNTIPNVSAVVFRREELSAVLAANIDQISSYRIAGDWLVYLMLLERGKLSFVPESLNQHRRHSGSVTLGGDNIPHLREVLSVQQHVRHAYPVNDSAREQARRYAEHLYDYFCLRQTSEGQLADREELKDLLA